MNKAVQLMISKLKTQCLTVTLDRDIGNYEVETKEGDVGDVGGTVPIPTTEDAQLECCEWRGTIGEWQEHSKICGFVEVECEHCRSHRGQRKEMAKHHEECPEMKIPCPLSCGM